MRAFAPVVVAIVAAAVAVVAFSGCREVGDAAVLVSLVDDGAQQSLRGVRARLTLTDEKGDHPGLRVLNIGGDDEVVIAKDAPLPCDAVACGAALRVDAGSYDVLLTLSATDRCNARGDILAFTGSFEVAHWGNASVDLVVDDVSFDADNDGIVNAFEAASCGRFNFDEGAAPPRQCAPEHDDCCAATSVEGGMMTFAGGSTTLPYGENLGGGVVAVDAFALDSTEVTWGQVERCVLAGLCLQNQPNSAARQTLAEPVDRHQPAVGLSPVDANAVCAFYGKRLPDDASWDFAAADRNGVRARYPFDVDLGEEVGCIEGTLEDNGAAAAFAAFGQSCPLTPQAVGSYPSSYVERGAGTPVADLAGNVAEWTLVRANDVAGDNADENGDGIPDGVIAVVLRGGGVTSFVELLENDLPLVFDAGSGRDRAAVTAATAKAGFRCAAAVADDVVAEPACPD